MDKQVVAALVLLALFVGFMFGFVQGNSSAIRFVSHVDRLIYRTK